MENSSNRLSVCTSSYNRNINTEPKRTSEIDHINQNKTDNSLSNLRWVTREENTGITLHNRKKF